MAKTVVDRPTRSDTLNPSTIVINTSTPAVIASTSVSSCAPRKHPRRENGVMKVVNKTARMQLINMPGFI